MDLSFLLLLLPTLFAVLYASIYVVNLLFVVKIENVKYKSIDGLRGYLAFFVFLHHSYIWYFYTHSAVWEEPKSNLFNQFGQTSVLFFFMITSFLFTNKLMEAKGTFINWRNFFLLRFFRLFPMYFFSIILLLAIVVYQSNGQITDKPMHILRDVIKWITFTISGIPDINNIDKTFIINAGIAWSLPYEWIFYLLLPFLGLFFKVKSSKKTLIIMAIILIVVILLNRPNFYLFLAFVGGIIAALVFYKKEAELKWNKPFFGFFIAFSIIFSIYFFHQGKDIIPLCIATSVFILITFENNFFTILHWPISRKLGQITYSFYLLHGIVLFFTFNCIIGIDKMSHFTFKEYWKIVCLCIFPTVLICQITYLYIESPFIKMAHKIVNKK